MSPARVSSADLRQTARKRSIADGRKQAEEPEVSTLSNHRTPEAAAAGNVSSAGASGLSWSETSKIQLGPNHRSISFCVTIREHTVGLEIIDPATEPSTAVTAAGKGDER